MGVWAIVAEVLAALAGQLLDRWRAIRLTRAEGRGQAAQAVREEVRDARRTVDQMAAGGGLDALRQRLRERAAARQHGSRRR